MGDECLGGVLRLRGGRYARWGISLSSRRIASGCMKCVIAKRVIRVDG